MYVKWSELLCAAVSFTHPHRAETLRSFQVHHASTMSFLSFFIYFFHKLEQTQGQTTSVSERKWLEIAQCLHVSGHAFVGRAITVVICSPDHQKLAYPFASPQSWVLWTSFRTRTSDSDPFLPVTWQTNHDITDCYYLTFPQINMLFFFFALLTFFFFAQLAAQQFLNLIIHYFLSTKSAY